MSCIRQRLVFTFTKEKLPNLTPRARVSCQLTALPAPTFQVSSIHLYCRLQPLEVTTMFSTSSLYVPCLWHCDRRWASFQVVMEDQDRERDQSILPTRRARQPRDTKSSPFRGCVSHTSASPALWPHLLPLSSCSLCPCLVGPWALLGPLSPGPLCLEGPPT